MRNQFGCCCRVVAQVGSGNENELCFVKATIVDKEGNVVPDANNLVHFTVTGSGFVDRLV